MLMMLNFISQVITLATLKKLITIAYWKKCKRLVPIVSKTNFIIFRSSKIQPDQSFDIKRDDEWGFFFSNSIFSLYNRKQLKVVSSPEPRSHSEYFNLPTLP